MEFLAFLVVAVATAMLWRRVDGLQREIALLRVELWSRQSEWAAPEEVAVAEPARPIEPARPLEAPAAEPVPPASVAEPEPSRRERFRLQLPRFDFEDMFGRLLPIWAGGVTLAVAGFFLVRWSIDAGLLTPTVRVALAGLFGLALLGGAEVAYRWRERVADPRVGQALAGAGLATLYAAFYLAGTAYGLIGSTLAFIGLAAVTGAGIALSFRFGLPSAVLGLVGGFAAPALVGSEEANLPLLTLYLALVTGGLAFTGRRQDRAWLGIAALAGGLGWGALLLMGAAPRTPDAIILGAYLVLLGGIIPVFSGGAGRPHWLVRVGAAGLAALQLAVLVQHGGFGALEWGLYLLLGGALAWFGWREPAMREANAVAAAVGVALLPFWPEPPPLGFAFASAGLAAIFAGVPLAQIWRRHGRTLDFAQASGVALGLALAAYLAFGDFTAGLPEPLLALATLAVALLPAAAVWPGWPARDHTVGRPVLGALASAAALGTAALLLALPAWAAPLAGIAPVTMLALLDWQRPDARVLAIGRAIAALGVYLAVALPHVGVLLEAEFGRAAGFVGAVDWRSPVRWAAAALAFVPLAWRERDAHWRHGAEGAVALLAYVAAAQVLPPEALAWVAALAAAVLASRFPRLGAIGALLAVAGLWALQPLLEWGLAGSLALTGQPLDVAELPSPAMLAQQLLPAVAALAVVVWRGVPDSMRVPLQIALAIIATIAVHIAYRYAFAALAGTDFVATGVIERAGWEVVLLGAAWFAWARGWRKAAIAFALAALAHFGWFALVLHNPLWSAQAVGALPLANLLLPAYAAGFAALLLLRRWLPGEPPWLRWAIDAAAMAAIALLALSELRQMFAGSLLTATPVGEGEDLLRSLLGIVLAVGFLLWGTRSGERSWRIGSLALMVIAVLKVFLVDAAGLAGLARIASFMALGFSLIGIGWFYARQLRPSLAPPAK